ncbi:MAG TPA: PIN/TRAM domain-containing protein [Clostridia bacterium]|nr:PIN/TRAM domain-containing protein [Clostridia bacterium]
MLRRVIRIILGLVGIAVGIALAWTSVPMLAHRGIKLIGYQDIVIYILFGIAFGILFFILSKRLIQFTVDFIRLIEQKLQEIPANDILFGVSGLMIGLLISYLVTIPFRQLEIGWLSLILTTLIYLFFGYLGISVTTKRWRELDWSDLLKKVQKDRHGHEVFSTHPKILDTSVIIDGRIFDICKTGFVEGPLIIPAFILEELRHIADSSDALKRNRGRRGLDILNQIQKELDIPVRIYEKDFDDIQEVDSKLLKLAQVLKGMVITNDYNLNKVAEFQGVPVLNINELANALKPVVLPGEEMLVQVIKDGKETGQGIAYLDDGTMIVVDGGKKHVGESIDVLVTSVLQTAAGRMIFAKPKAIDRVV